MNSLSVIAFVGPSGSGKSSALKVLSDRYEVLRERYMELNHHSLDNRLLVSKWAYNNYWFDEIFKARARAARLLLTDRCPYDTCAYVKHGQAELFTIVGLAVGELRPFDITVKTVLVTASLDVLEARICKRLESEPKRRDYHEENHEHNKRALEFYMQRLDKWDTVIDTSSLSAERTVEALETAVRDFFT